MKIASAKDLTVYKKSYALAMRIFQVTKRLPPEEKFHVAERLRFIDCMNAFSGLNLNKQATRVYALGGLVPLLSLFRLR